MIDKGALCLCHNVFSRIITADKVIIIVEQIHRTICQSRNQQEKDRQWPRQTYLLLQGDNHSQQSRIDGREKNCSGSDHIDKNFPGDPPHRLRALYLHTTKPRMRIIYYISRLARASCAMKNKTKQALAGNVSANAVPCVENHTYIVSNQAFYSSYMGQRGIAWDSILLLTYPLRKATPIPPMGWSQDSTIRPCVRTRQVPHSRHPS